MYSIYLQNLELVKKRISIANIQIKKIKDTIWYAFVAVFIDY